VISVFDWLRAALALFAMFAVSIAGVHACQRRDSFGRTLILASSLVVLVVFALAMTR
jgi:hypothetical protein